MTDLFLRITTPNISEMDEYEFPVARPHDDETEPGKCHMSVNRQSAIVVRDLLQKRKRGVELTGGLVERLSGDNVVPVDGHHELLIVDAIPDDAFQDQHAMGGGRVVAEKPADQLPDYQPTDAAVKGSDKRPLPSDPGSFGTAPAGSKVNR